MGFFQRCSEVLLQFLSFSTSWDAYGLQKPLDLGDAELRIRPETAAPGFTCEYPTLTGWKNCNSPGSRDCWLRDTTSDQPLFSQYE